MGIPHTHRDEYFEFVGAVAEEEAFERATQVSPLGGHFCNLLVMHQACERDGFIDRP